MDGTFLRTEELACLNGVMPGSTWHLARVLLARSASAGALVLIRRLRCIAVMGSREFLFVKQRRPRDVVLVWRHFELASRERLVGPVGYEAVCYSTEAADLHAQLQTALLDALKYVVGRDTGEGGASIIPLLGGVGARNGLYTTPDNGRLHELQDNRPRVCAST